MAALQDSLGKSAHSELTLFALYWLVVTFPCGIVHIMVMIRLRVAWWAAGGSRNRQISALDGRRAEPTTGKSLTPDAGAGCIMQTTELLTCARPDSTAAAEAVLRSCSPSVGPPTHDFMQFLVVARRLPDLNRQF